MTPKVGETVFVDDIDLTSGTFIQGGRATVSRVLVEDGGVFIQVDEVPGGTWRWDGALDSSQDELRTDVVAGRVMMRMSDGSIRPLVDATID